MSAISAEGATTLAQGREEATALVWEDATISYAALARSKRALVRQLASLDVRPGDLVAIAASPSPIGVALIHAMLETGRPFLPLNARLTEREQRDAIEETGARFLIVDAGADPVARAERIVGETGCGRLALVSDGDEGRLDRVAPPAGEPRTWSAARARRVDEGAALVLRTSGTSGVPKGAVLGLDNLMASADGSARLLGSAASDRWLLCMPLFHIGGLSILIRAARVGASVVLHPRFDAEAVARSLERDGVTRVSFVAAMLEQVLAAREGADAPSGLELVLLGGGPASDALLERAHAQGYPVAPTYGLTEAASQVATRPPLRGRRLPNDEWAGGLEPLAGLSLRVVDAEGRAVEAGEAGEIQVQGPVVMRGYLDDPAATARTLSAGWLATGDIGRLDARGRLRVLDRRSDLIVSGGENVYPAEIESILEGHPAIREAGVCATPDARFGARPLAWVVVDAGAAFDEAELLAYCRERLAGFKCPVAIGRLEALPRNATGKLLRRSLPDRASAAGSGTA